MIQVSNLGRRKRETLDFILRVNETHATCSVDNSAELQAEKSGYEAARNGLVPYLPVGTTTNEDIAYIRGYTNGKASL